MGYPDLHCQLNCDRKEDRRAVQEPREKLIWPNEHWT